MRATLLFVVLLSACTTASGRDPFVDRPTSGACSEPTRFVVDSRQWLDVVVRTPSGQRLGVARSLSVSRFESCNVPPQTSGVLLDPMASSRSYYADATSPFGPGWTVHLDIGTSLNISFIRTVPPDEE